MDQPVNLEVPTADIVATCPIASQYEGEAHCPWWTEQGEGEGTRVTEHIRLVHADVLRQDPFDVPPGETPQMYNREVWATYAARKNVSPTANVGP